MTLSVFEPFTLVVSRCGRFGAYLGRFLGLQRLSRDRVMLSPFAWPSEMH